MAVFDPGEPHNPRARSLLEYLRGIGAVACLVMAGLVVLDRKSGGFEYVVFLVTAAGVFLGLDVFKDLIRKRNGS